MSDLDLCDMSWAVQLEMADEAEKLVSEIYREITRVDNLAKLYPEVV